MSHLDVVKIKTGSPYESKAGYSRAVAVGDVVMVSLTAGIDYATRIMPADASGQATQCLSTIAAALAAAGSGLLDVVRVRAIVPHAEDWDAVIEVLGDTFRGIDPTLTFTAAPLAGDYLVEIEVTAWRGAGSSPAREITLLL